MEDIPDEEHFEDFTTASDWELFTANLEQILTEWQTCPAQSDFIHNGWLILHEKVTFADFPFKITYYKNLSQSHHEPERESIVPAPTQTHGIPIHILKSTSEDNPEFPPTPSPHPLAELYCLTEFGVLSSATLEPIKTESKLKVLLSSCTIGLNNSNSSYPIFVQYHHWNQGYFCGISEASGIRTSYPMIHLRSVPSQYQYLSGMLDLFKSKIEDGVSGPVMITVHFFYSMTTWHPDLAFRTDGLELLEKLQEADATSIWELLPFGCEEDPFSSLTLVTGWPCLTEDAVVDNQNHTDLVPDSAPEMWYSLRHEENTSSFLRLTSALDEVWKIQNEFRSVEEILGKKLGGGNQNDNLQFSSALDKIALGTMSPVPGVHRVLSNVSRVAEHTKKQLLFSPLQYADLAPLSQAQLNPILSFLFPDSCRKTARYPYPDMFDENSNNGIKFRKEYVQKFYETISGVKSAPIDSLVSRIALVLPYILNVAGLPGIAHLWAELILELRFRFENTILITGIERGAPNTGTCLLNQKFQMLNCCIDKKLEREKKDLEKEKGLDGQNGQIEEESEEEDDEEFFDCNEDTDMNFTTHKPLGRLRKCGRLKLLKTGEPLFIPITQDPAPATEDLIEEQSKLLVELGDDAEGSELRAQIMSASLSSDMESFKAANPGAVLEDFVRWYSPRDWIESDNGDGEGELSPRMKLPGNLWVQVWSNAQPVPARRQKRLFDDTKEAEKVLKWMSSHTLSSISKLLFPCLCHLSAIKVLGEIDKLNLSKPYSFPPSIPSSLVSLSRALGEDVIKITNSHTESHNIYSKSHFLSLISQVESDICQIHSFQLKFPQVELCNFLSPSSTCQEDSSNQNPKTKGGLTLPNFIKVNDEELVDRIKEIFNKELSLNNMIEAASAAAGSISPFQFIKPIKKVFVLKYNPKGSNNSTQAPPQRMSCILTDEDVRFAGCFSSKTQLS